MSRVHQPQALQAPQVADDLALLVLHGELVVGGQGAVAFQRDGGLGVPQRSPAHEMLVGGFLGARQDGVSLAPRWNGTGGDGAGKPTPPPPLLI